MRRAVFALIVAAGAGSSATPAVAVQPPAQTSQQPPAPADEATCPDGSRRYLGTCEGDDVLTGIQGYWTRQDMSCDVKFSYSVVQENLTRRIVLDGEETGSQIITLEGMTIVTRDSELWIWQLAGDALSITDSKGITTTLKRCK